MFYSVKIPFKAISVKHVYVFTFLADLKSDMMTAYNKKFNLNAVIYKITRYPIYAIKTLSK